MIHVTVAEIYSVHGTNGYPRIVKRSRQYHTVKKLNAEEDYSFRWKLVWKGLSDKSSFRGAMFAKRLNYK